MMLETYLAVIAILSAVGMLKLSMRLATRESDSLLDKSVALLCCMTIVGTYAAWTIKVLDIF